MTFADSVARAVADTTREWVAIKKKEERDRQQSARMAERHGSGRSSRITVKDSANVVISDAYLKASGGGQYPANARQIMYAARPEIQQTTGQVACRKLYKDVTVLVLHDFDKSGFSILGTLTRDTRRYSYATETSVADLGLRLHDVQQWELLAEEVIHASDPTENLRLNRASEEEIEFLRGKRCSGYDPTRYRGRRAELNAFTSEQFVKWLESKLKTHNIVKVIPDSVTLEQAYRRAAAIRDSRAILATLLEEVDLPRRPWISQRI